MALAFAGATSWLLHPLSTDPVGRLYDGASFRGGLPGHPDVLVDGWILAWVSHALASGRVADLFDAPIFHPQPRTLAYSEHLLGIQPWFAPVYAVSGDLALALNVTAWLSFVLSGLGMYAVAWAWWRSHPASVVAAVLWAFAPWRFFGLVHLHTLSVQYLPLLAWAVWETGTRRSRGLWCAIAGLAFWQTLCSYYLGYVGFLTASVLLLASLAARPGERAARAAFTASALVAATLLLVPVSLPYLGLEREGAFEGRQLIADPAAYLWNVLYPEPSARGAAAPGWGAWLAVPVLAAWGAAAGVASRGERARALACLALATLGLWLAAGPQLEVAGLRLGAVHDLLAAVVPGWAALRVTGRFAIAAWFALALLGALPFRAAPSGVASFARARGALAAAVVAALLFSAARIELRTQPAPDAVRDLAPYLWLARRPPGEPVLEWPVEFGRRDSEAQWLGTLHWQPLVNGYSSYRPPSYEMLAAVSASLPDPRAVETLRRLGSVRWLLVHDAERDWLDGAPRDWSALESAGATRSFEASGVRIYSLPGPIADPPLALVPETGLTLFGTPTGALSARALAAGIEPLAPRIVTDGRNHWVPLRVTNRSQHTWPAVAPQRDGLVGLFFQVLPADGGPPRPLRGFSRLPADLAPGASAVVRARLHPPQAPGDHRLLPCLGQWGGVAARCFPESALSLRVVRDLDEDAIVPSRRLSLRPLPPAGRDGAGVTDLTRPRAGAPRRRRGRPSRRRA